MTNSTFDTETVFSVSEADHDSMSDFDISEDIKSEPETPRKRNLEEEYCPTEYTHPEILLCLSTISFEVELASGHLKYELMLPESSSFDGNTFFGF